MESPRVALVVVIAAILCVTVSSYPYSWTKANKFMVTWSPLPGGLFQTKGFYEMPRTTTAAKKQGFSQEADRSAIDQTTVWCRQKDYRVCVLFDMRGSVAGIQVSHSAAEITASGAPVNLDNDPQWFKHTFVGTEVYSTITYFVDKETLQRGGRYITGSTLTAPNGIRVLETRGAELSSMDIPLQESAATSNDFVEQNCFLGMGQHYFQELSPESKCENSRPYFTLYGKGTKTLHGFGVKAFGKISKGARTWFEQPPALAVQMIAPNSPSCLNDWVNKYTLNTIHVFFIPNPWLTTCTCLI